MRTSTQLRWLGAICIAFAISLVYVIIANAQTFGSPQTVITAYRYLNITGLTLVTATASSDLTVSYY